MNTNSHLLLSLEEGEIRAAFQTLSTKIDQLEERLKYLDKLTLYPEVRQNTLQTFITKLALFEGEIGQVKERESIELQKSTDYKQAFAQKYKNLSSNIERILRENSKLDSISRLSNAFVDSSSESDSPSHYLQNEGQQHSETSFRKFSPSLCSSKNSPSFDSSDDMAMMMTLSPTIKKLLKSPRFEERLTMCDKSEDDFTDISTPPLLSKLSLISSSSVGIDEIPSGAETRGTNSTDEDTPRLSLSKRSLDFFKSLLSPPKAASVEKKTPVSQDENSSCSSKFSFSKFTNSIYGDNSKHPTTPLANKTCSVDDEFNSSGLEHDSFTFYEANSVCEKQFEDGNFSDSNKSSPFEANAYEFRFKSRFAN